MLTIWDKRNCCKSLQNYNTIYVNVNSVYELRDIKTDE